MLERYREKAEKASRQKMGFKVTPGEAAKLKEIVSQIDELLFQITELEKKRVLWWENQLRLAGLPEGDYQFLLEEEVIVRRESRDMGNNFDELDRLVDEIYDRWRESLN